MSEIWGLGIVVLVLGLGLASVAWTARLGWTTFWLKRPRTKAEKVLVAMLCGTVALGCLGSLLGALRVFGAIGGESVDSSQRARILAEGISELMNFSSVAVGIWIPIAATFLIVSMRAKKQPKG